MTLTPPTPTLPSRTPYTETNVAVTYDDSDGTLDFVVSADSALIKDTDNDTKIQAEESSDEDKLRYDIAGTEVAVLNLKDFCSEK